VKNILTVDVEDYSWIVARDIMGVPAPISQRVVDSTTQLMDTLIDAGVGATFFCLGNVARKYPDLIREIRRRGFAVGSHGMDHLLYHRMGLAEIRHDLAESKTVLEDTIGEEIDGFRAPHFNVSLARPEVIESIIEAGYRYDSSVFPVRGRRYGSPDSPRRPFRIKTPSGTLWEFPLAAIVLAGCRFPAAGGGYLRHFPYFVTRTAIRSLNREGIPATVYLHPYECDTVPVSFPPADLTMAKRLRTAIFNRHQYHNRSKTIKKIQALARDFSFVSIPGMLERIQQDEFPEINLATDLQ